MGFGYLLVLIFVAYAALKFYHSNRQASKDAANRGSLQPGVSYYCNLSVTHRPQQIQAFTPTNPCQVSCAGYAPAFGPEENMPSCESFCVGIGQHVLKNIGDIPSAKTSSVPPASPTPVLRNMGDNFYGGQ